MESNFRALSCFVIAAEELNFTRAARKLYITQQSLSKHIRKLEEQYEVRLFERQPTMKLTLAGEHLLKYARQMLREEKKLFNDLQSESTEGRVRLSVGLPTFRSAAYLPGIIQAYHGLRPNVVTSYQTFSFPAVNTALRAGDIDLYFSAIGAAGKFGKRLPITPDQLYFVVSEALLKKQMPERWQDFLRCCRGGVSLAEAAEFPIILPPANTALRNILDTHFEKAAHIPNVMAELSDGSARLEMCAGDFCAALIPKSQLFRQHLRLEAPIYALHVGELDDLSWLGIIYSENEALPSYVTDYIDCAKEVIIDANAGLDEYLASLVTAEGVLPL